MYINVVRRFLVPYVKRSPGCFSIPGSRVWTVCGLVSAGDPGHVSLLVAREMGSRVCSVLCGLVLPVAIMSGIVEALGDSWEESRSVMEKALCDSRQPCLLSGASGPPWSVLVCQYHVGNRFEFFHCR